MTTTHPTVETPPFDGDPHGDRDQNRHLRPTSPNADVARHRGDGDDPQEPFGRRLVLALAVAIPLLVLLWVGIVALAISLTGAGYAAPLAMGAGVGVLAGVFWGTFYCFATEKHRPVERDRHATSTEERS
jgi:hypothetical protein